MKRLTPTERGGVVFGVLCLCAGLDVVIWPQAGVVLHFANDALGLFPHDEPRAISTTSSRVYGVLAILAGAGVVFASVYHEKQ